MSILNIGTQALLANQVALQTAGNNIANANTVGYSRQTVIMQAVEGQYTGAGYVGKGVGVQTIQRNFDEYLTRQARLTASMQSGDQLRAENLKKIEGLFSSGKDGVGAAISEMLNSFSDVASAPTDLTARTVALTRVNETVSRIRSLSTSLDDLQSNTLGPVDTMVQTVNSLATKIADLNKNIARVHANGQPPNDLLDQRDQLVSEMSQYVQTTTIPADDGTVGVFIGGSQPIVLGTAAASLSVTMDSFTDPLKRILTLNRNGQTVPLDENTLGGGKMPALLKFSNTDIAEARNLLGRLTLSTTTAMNAQHKLGLDLDGNVGGNLFTPMTFDSHNILPQTTGNTGSATLGLAINDITKFVASDYQVDFTSATTGTITRMSDGVITSFPQTPSTTAPVMATVDGLDFQNTSGTAAAGDRYLIKPYSTITGTIQSEFSSPRSLAVASPVVVQATGSNKGSLQISGITAKNSAAPLDTYKVTFSVVAGVSTYSIQNTTTPLATPVTGSYVSGQPITYAPTGTPGWSLTLTGAPANQDSMTISATPAAYRNLNGGNATAMMNLRDTAMFDGSALTDGYAGLLATIGVRSQTATYTANVSTNLATSAEKNRASVSGVNLDEEASKLLQYQQAYQASAKMVQIAQSIFTNLIQSL